MAKSQICTRCSKFMKQALFSYAYDMQLSRHFMIDSLMYVRNHVSNNNLNAVMSHLNKKKDMGRKIFLTSQGFTLNE